jgi:type VI secretion system protein ImpJ
MAWDNRVLWSEGLFLQPHHLQQHDRYIERLTRGQAGVGTPYPWGLRRLAIDQDLLGLGKLAVTDCAGLLPDGTPFDAPGSDPLPPPLDLGDDAAGQVIYLALPLARPGAAESGGPEAQETMLRYRVGELTVRDSMLGSHRDPDGGGTARSAPDARARRPRRLRLLRAGAGPGVPGGSPGGARSRLYPPCIDYRAGGRLADFVDELQGLLHRQAESRAGACAARAAAGSRIGPISCCCSS